MLKQHLRIDGTEEDSLLQSYVDAASLLIRRETGKNFVLGEDGYEDIARDALFQQAVRMLVAHWYENRQPVGAVTGEIPFAVTHLNSQIAMGRSYSEDKEREDES